MDAQSSTGILVNQNASGSRHETRLGYNWAYSHMEKLLCQRFANNLVVEGSNDPYSESQSSKFTDGLKLWPVIFGHFVSRPAGATAILETTWHNYFHCSNVRTILWQNGCCILCWSPITCQSYLAVSTATGILIHEDTCRILFVHPSQFLYSHRHSNSLASPNL